MATSILDRDRTLPRRTGLLTRFRARCKPIAAGTLVAFALSTASPSLVWAQVYQRDGEEAHVLQTPAGHTLDAVPETIREERDDLDTRPELTASDREHVDDHITQSADPKTQTERITADLGTQDGTQSDQGPGTGTLALPTGADKSGVTSQAISIPSGAGKIEGMGESFSAQLSTGIATFSVPFVLPAARGAAQPSLGLAYSSASGLGVAGMGWSVGVPFIARQTDRGLPSYDDRATWHPNQDRFVYNGGQELVPICTVNEARECLCTTGADGVCRGGAREGERMPPWSAHSQYFRPRIEGSFLRFFWSPDHKTWRVQDKSGVTMELGVPLDGSNDNSALERNPDAEGEIYTWNLVRQYDTYGGANPADATTHPTPFNVVVYKYFQDGGQAYLQDIFDTTPSAAPTTTDLSSYAHHTRLIYERRSDPTVSYRTGWRIDQQLRLKRVDVASKAFNEGTNALRKAVRRYHLAYDDNSHVSLLASVEVEGRCAQPGADPNTIVDEASAQSETGAGVLPESTGCPRLPPMRFGYSHVSPFDTAGAADVADLEGYEGFDERVHEISGDPLNSIDEELSDLFDINSDALPDVLVTAPGTYNDDHAVFFNSPGGKPDAFGAVQRMGVAGVLGANSNTIKLSNANVAPLDIDGDATIDLLHMPTVKTYSIYTPQLTAGRWKWVGHEVTTASAQNPKIDFGRDTLDTRVADVNFDGLVDVVVSAGTRFQTFLSLGRYAGGDGQFGTATWTSATTSQVSNDPIASCVPFSGNPVRFSDPDIRLGEMNGDGIPDIVRIRRGDIRYWPGRGNGYWGTGRRNDCPADSFGADRDLQMAASPFYSDVEGSSLNVDDVNGDGLDDLVQVRFDAVDIWLNVDGAGWTSPHTIRHSPVAKPYANRVRLVDVNGSGTRDILWGDGRDYKYIDLQGGQKPWLLTRIENGLGKSTDIEYSTSTAEMLAAEATAATCDPAKSPWACPWSSKMPIVAHVVKRTTESDNLVIAGKGPGRYQTEYSYRDPVFEGRQREFRGFRHARTKHIGDENSPTDLADSTFLLGECKDETVGSLDDGVDDCAVSERWRDNRREALKGVPVLAESYDEAGTYLSTEAITYRLRRLYVGLDGREVRQAFENGKSRILYDTALGTASGTASVVIPAVELELEEDPNFDPLAAPLELPATVTVDEEMRVPIRQPSGHAEISSKVVLDFFGNTLLAVSPGCIDGDACPLAQPGTEPDEVIFSYTLPGLPDEEQTGWLWRPVHTFVSGSVNTGRRNETLTSYSPEGDPVLTEAVLEGSGSLDRFRSSGSGPIGNPPVAASVDADESDPLFVSRRTYNAFGLVTQEETANNRCRAVGYSTDAYGVLPTLEQTFRGGCGNSPLIVSAVYDRGFGFVSTAVDMQGQSTFVDYDGLGRLREARRPHPSGDTAKASRLATTKVKYFLAGSEGRLGHSIIHVETQDGDGPASGEYQQGFSYVDGFGRTLVTIAEADTDAGDEAPWIADDLSQYDSKSAVGRRYIAFFTHADPMAFPIHVEPSAPYGRQRYDAFSRQLQTFDVDGTVTLQSRYHALSTDFFDAADLDPGPHQGTPVTIRSDGHGRVIVNTERIHVAGVIEEREMRTRYLPTGQPRVLTRIRVGKADLPVVRWMRYDSLGRMVLNVEAHTTANFSPDPNTNPTPGPTGLKAWRYAYDDLGELVGTSDARGCGTNFFYDGVGRIIGEDYSPCEAHHAAYTPPTDLSTGAGLETFYVYDDAVAPDLPQNFTLPPLFPTPATNPTQAQFLTGRLVAVFDRGSATFSRYDGRGRVTQNDTRIYRTDAVANAPFGNGAASRYASNWFSKDFAFDAVDREVASTTGSTLGALQGAALTQYGFSGARDNSVVTTEYSHRGTVRGVGGSFQTLIASIHRTADGLQKEVIYGDVAGTRSSLSYDNRRRLASVQTYRGPPGIWDPATTNYVPSPQPGGAPTSFQLLLQDEDFTYDAVNNPTEIRDWRHPDEWPSSAKPVTRTIEYDDLYRVTRVEYRHTGGADAWADPFAVEASGQTPDPRRAQPSPRMSFTQRLQWQTFNYDWLGNTAKTDDDAKGFYDRSLGAINNDVAAGKPYQLKSATNKAGGLGSTGNPTPNGEVQVSYDAAGNLVRLDLQRNGTCVGVQCNQRFNYRWDEVGRLVRALRWDVAYSPGAAFPADGAAAADLTYHYNAGDERVLKVAAGAPNRHTVYVFDSLELRRTTLSSSNYVVSEDTEVPYVIANGVRVARIVLEGTTDGEPRIGIGDATRLHVFLELTDHLGSTGVVLDKATGELVERTTYQPYGGVDSDYRPNRWRGFREDYRFTGKEEDVEVGLQYFGKRFLSPNLGRWLSPDPLALHALGADPNLYAYVHGQALKATDPLGLAGGRAWSEAEKFASSAGAQNAEVEHTYKTLKNEAKIELLAAGQADEFDAFVAKLNAWRARNTFAQPDDPVLKEAMRIGHDARFYELEIRTGALFAAYLADGIDKMFYPDENYLPILGGEGGCPEGVMCSGMSSGVRAAVRVAGKLGKSLPAQLALKLAKEIGRRKAFVGHNIRLFAKGDLTDVGRRVLQRMINEGEIALADATQDAGRLSKFTRVIYKGEEKLLGDFEAGHIEDAVKWWNETGRKTGARSKEVREWMSNENNYKLQLMPENRAAGPGAGHYEDPLK